MMAKNFVFHDLRNDDNLKLNDIDASCLFEAVAELEFQDCAQHERRKHGEQLACRHLIT